MLNKAIELLELEIRRLKNLVVELHEDKCYSREGYRTRELERFQRILDLLVKEETNESSS